MINLFLSTEIIVPEKKTFCFLFPFCGKFLKNGLRYTKKLFIIEKSMEVKALIFLIFA